jgi:hypothetical protein
MQAKKAAMLLVGFSEACEPSPPPLFSLLTKQATDQPLARISDHLDACFIQLSDNPLDPSSPSRARI